MLNVVGPEDVSNEENTAVLTTKKARNKKQAEPDINFTKALDNEMPDIFAPPKNLKSLLLPSNRAPCDTKLPEDCHYQPEDLVKLFLLPNVMVMCATSLLLKYDFLFSPFGFLFIRYMFFCSALVEEGEESCQVIFLLS